MDRCVSLGSSTSALQSFQVASFKPSISRCVRFRNAVQFLTASAMFILPKLAERVCSGRSLISKRISEETETYPQIARFLRLGRVDSSSRTRYSSEISVKRCRTNRATSVLGVFFQFRMVNGDDGVVSAIAMRYRIGRVLQATVRHKGMIMKSVCVSNVPFINPLGH